MSSNNSSKEDKSSKSSSKMSSDSSEMKNKDKPEKRKEKDEAKVYKKKDLDKTFEKSKPKRSEEKQGKLSNISRSRSILKNGGRRDYSYSFKMKDFAENLAADVNQTDVEKAVKSSEEADKHKMQSNLKIRSWSVASFDTCSGDVRRTLSTYYTGKLSRWITGSKSLAVFLGKNEDEVFDIAAHEDSDFEDDEPYGPHDVDSSFYKRRKAERQKQRQKTRQGRGKRGQSLRRSAGTVSLKMNRIRSLASFGQTKKTTNDRNKSSGKNSFRSRVGQLSKNFSKKKKESTISRTTEEYGEEEAKLRLRLKQHREKQESGEDSDGSFSERRVGESHEKPKYVPPDMQWDSKRNVLVNRKPAFIPEGKMWSPKGLNGKGCLINRPPPSSTIPPGLVWSRTAFNGQGGLVNMKPRDTPEGLMWDYDAEEGKGGFVKASDEYLEKLKLERAEKAEYKKRKVMKRKKKKILQKKSRRGRTTGQVNGTNLNENEEKEYDPNELTPSRLKREALLKEVEKENEEIIAELDKIENEQNEAEYEEKEGIHHSFEDLDANDYVLQEDNESVLILQKEVVHQEKPRVTLKKARKKREKNSKPNSRTIRTAKVESATGSPPKSDNSRKKRISLKKSMKRKSILEAAKDTPINKQNAKVFGITEGTVLQMFDTYERISLHSLYTDNAIKLSDSENSDENDSIL